MNLTKKLSLIVALVFAAFCAPAMAYTDCNDTIKWMHAEVGNNNTMVYLSSGATFYIYANDTNKAMLLSLAQLSMTGQFTVTARFTATGLTCSTATGRTDLTTLYSYGPVGP